MSLSPCSPRRPRDGTRHRGGVPGGSPGCRTPAPMRAVRAALAIAAGTVALAVASMLGSPASALATPNVVGAIANVQGNEPLNQTVPMLESRHFNSTTIGERGTIFHHAVGVYTVTFNGLVPEGASGGFVDPGGVAHVRTRGGGGVCHAPGVAAGTTADRKLHLIVRCWDAAGRPLNQAFTLSYTRGGTQQGSLVTARMPNGAFLPLNQKVQLKGETSINASTPSTTNSGVSVTRTGVGAYTFQMFAGTGPSTIQISPSLSGFKPGAVCAITGTSVASGIKSVKVQCYGPLGNTGPVDVGLNLSYARGINTLGLTALSSAYLTMPKTTAASTQIPAGDMLNTIDGLTSGAVVLRSSPGRYEVRLPNQQRHRIAETFSVTAEGSTAQCEITSSTAQLAFQQLGVACSNSGRHATDTGFQLHYAGKQTAVGRLRLSPDVADARAGKVAHLQLRWKHPEAWRQLRSVEVRLHRGADRVGTIAISPRSERIRSRGDVRLVRRASSVAHRGKSVIARLAVRLPKTMAGQRLRVDVEATDRDGRHQLERGAGLIKIN
jgi:hypothetical protein